jgi:hypothetical protein
MPFALVTFRASRRELGNWPETAFEEIGALATVKSIKLPRSGLLARNNFRFPRQSEVTMVGNGFGTIYNQVQ